MKITALSILLSMSLLSCGVSFDTSVGFDQIVVKQEFYDRSPEITSRFQLDYIGCRKTRSMSSYFLEFVSYQPTKIEEAEVILDYLRNSYFNLLKELSENTNAVSTWELDKKTLNITIEFRSASKDDIKPPYIRSIMVYDDLVTVFYDGFGKERIYWESYPYQDLEDRVLGKSQIKSPFDYPPEQRLINRYYQHFNF